uniref:Uncharacterized protein n=1 Tax=Fagus sylvatica TaxID=28930 RepID=A0A2N9FKM5_FAGSY
MNTEVLVGCIHCKMAWIVSLEYLRREHTSRCNELPGAVPVTNGGKPENIKEEKKSKQQRKKERKEKNNAAKAKAKAKAKEAQPTRSQPAKRLARPVSINGWVTGELSMNLISTDGQQFYPKPDPSNPSPPLL